MSLDLAVGLVLGFVLAVCGFLIHALLRLKGERIDKLEARCAQLETSGKLLTADVHMFGDRADAFRVAANRTAFAVDRDLMQLAQRAGVKRYEENSNG